MLLQKREEGLKIDSESERLKTCGGGLRSPSYRAMENHIQRKGMNKMNQTQTRSPRKRLLSLILAVILMIGLLPISAFATSASAQASEDKAATQDSEFLRIFHLDCGRKYFTVSEIEGIIDQLAENHYTHIQLAFGNNGFRFLLNDMSVKANNKTYSSDDVKDAVTNGNTTYSNGKNTASTMLSETDMDTIVAYAKGKDISIIPMLNTPGHMDALVSAMSKLSVGTQRSDSEMSLTSDAQVEFIKALQQKYITYFASKGSKYYNLAADEYSFSGLSDTEYTVFAKYVNDVAKMVKDAQMTPLAYNDGFLYSGKTTSVPFDKDIVICYWAQDTNYASVTELHNAGFKILNNNDAWYYVLGDYLNFWAHPQWRYADAKEGIQKVPVTQAKNVADKEIPVVGSVLCCWCDGPHLSWADSKDKVYDLIATMAESNPDYFKDTAPVLAPVDGGTVSPVKQADGSYNVAVAANDTVQLKLSNASDVSWSSNDEAVATVNAATGLVTFTGKTGTVKITAQLQPVTRADEGASYTVTFNVTEKGAPIPVTVAVGRTVKETLQGNQTAISGNYSEFVTVTAEHKTTTAEKKLLEITSASDLVSGAQYLIANQRHGGLLTGVASSDWDNQYVGLQLSGEASSGNNTNLWTITQSGSAYTAQYKGSNYLTIGENVATVSGSNTSTINLAYNNDGYWTISQNGYYLNHLGTSNTAGGWKDNAAATDEGSRWTIYRIVEEGATDTTTVSFTGKKVGGPVTVTVGDTTYSVTVVEKQNVEIPISIIDYRADGLLFDWTYNPKSGYADSYRYGLVHGKAADWGPTVGSGTSSKLNTSTGLYEVDGYASSNVEQIEGTIIQKTSNSNSNTTFYSNSTDNNWSRAGLVQEKLGANGMPVYTDAAVKYVASLLKAGYYNEMSGNCNSLIYNTFVASNGSRTIRNTSASGFSDNFKNAKTYANISNAYDLAWYLLNTIYQADTNMTTVTGTDKKEHSVPIYGMAVDAYKSIVLTDNGTGTYSFEAGYSGTKKDVRYDQESGTIYNGTNGGDESGFYPLENLGYEQPGLLTATSKVNNGAKNGGFTLRGESQFVYNEASNLYFQFTGDDDVYMYINGVLALDLGGAHGRNSKTVNLNDLDATKYGLKEGQVATFTFFYMERCSDASTFGIETNMELVQRAINVEKKAYDTSYGAEYADGASISTTTDNPTTVAYDLILTNKGNTDMHQISFTDQDTQGGTAAFGYDVTNPYVNDSNTATVTLGELSTYLIYVTDGDNVVESTRKTLTTLNELSKEVGKVTLAPGQSLHVRFLTATFKVPNATIQDYTNTVHATAYTKGETHQPLEDDASHELYSYNASDTGRTYVVDFGLPLKIYDIFNDAAKGYIGDVTYNPGKNNLKYGTVDHVVSDKANTTLIYTRTADKTIDGAEKIVLDVQYTMDKNTVTLDKTLTIIPASNVYYEDSLATFTNGKGVAQNAVWSTVGNNGQTTTEDGGSNVYQALEELGGATHNVYGYDGQYSNSSMLSMGTAHKVTVTAAMLEAYNGGNKDNFAWPTAQFTFKGTGFDIISLTDNTSGAIMVTVEGVTDTTYKKNFLVNNYYGYAYDKDKNEWVTVASGDSNAIYQIPVMKVNGIPYGEYKVTIGVLYNSLFDKTGNSAYSFWLDAVRIYDPMGEYTGYTQDNEGYPQYIKLHDEVVSNDVTVTNALFIDGEKNATIQQYTNLGPNNEVYLMKGQAITFKLTGDTGKIASVQIGAKAPKGTVELKVNDSVVVEKLSTATEMYYDITTQATGDNNYQVTITNTTGNILSLTNLKITYSEKGSVSLGTLNTQEQESAVSLVRALFTAPVATFSPETFEADWGRAVRAGKRATLTVKTSADVESITVDGQSITGYTTRTQRTGWGWWSPKVTYHVFTYTIAAPAQTTDYAVCAVNAEGTASEAVTATLTVKPTTWWNWWF